MTYLDLLYLAIGAIVGTSVGWVIGCWIYDNL